MSGKRLFVKVKSFPEGSNSKIMSDIMKEQRIAALLEKYWQAETTVEEERELAAYFRGPAVPVEWETYREVFGFFAAEAEVVPGEDLGQRILRAVRPRRLGMAWWAAAAVIVLVVGLVNLSQPEKGPVVEGGAGKEQQVYVVKDTYDDPQQALAAVQKALLTVSKNLNKGIRPLN